MAEVQSLNTLSRIAQLRAKSLSGELTREEMKEAINLMRGDRKNAARASESSKRKVAKAAIPDADTMLNELEGL